VDENIAREILDELFSSLETLETRSAALLQFVKDKGFASEQNLAPYFEQAANASSVRWRAARVRIEHLLASAFRAADQETKVESRKPKGKNDESSRNNGEDSSTKKEGKQENNTDSRREQKKAADVKPGAPEGKSAAKDSPNRQNDDIKNKKEEENQIKNEAVQEKPDAREEKSSDNDRENAA
jgi:hypothetical protein